MVSIDIEYVFKKYKQYLYTIISNSKFCGIDNEDVFQEVIIEIWKKLKKYNHKKSSLKTFITMIAINKIRDLRKFTLSKKRFGDFYHITFSYLEKINPSESILIKSSLLT